MRDHRTVTLRSLALASVMGLMVVGCGGSSSASTPNGVIADYAKALRTRDAALFCRSLFLSTDLPPDLARQAGVSFGQGTPADWDREFAECRSSQRKGFPPGLRNPPPLTVIGVSYGPRLARKDGISQIAKVRVKVGRSRRATEFPVVRFRGQWKVIFAVD